MKVGTQDIIDLKNGDIQINKVYSGVEIVWTKVEREDTFVLLTTESNTTPKTYKWNYTTNELIYEIEVGNTSDIHSVYFGQNPNGSVEEVEYNIINRNYVSGVTTRGWNVYKSGSTPQNPILIASINTDISTRVPLVSGIYLNRYLVLSTFQGVGRAIDFQTNITYTLAVGSSGHSFLAITKSGENWLYQSQFSNQPRISQFPGTPSSSSFIILNLNQFNSKKLINTGNLKNYFMPVSINNNQTFYLIRQTDSTFSFGLYTLSVGSNYINATISDETDTTTFIYITHRLNNNNFLSKYRFDTTTFTYTLLWRTGNSSIITLNQQIETQSTPGLFYRNNQTTIGVFYVDLFDNDLVKIIHFDKDTGLFVKIEDFPYSNKNINRCLVYDKNNW